MSSIFINNIIEFFKSPFSKKRGSNKNTPGTDIPVNNSLQHKIQQYKSEYYDIRARLDNINSESYTERRFLEKLNSEYFHNRVSSPFKHLCGVIGGGYAVVDKPQNKILFIQNKYLKRDQNQDIPFYRLPYQINPHPEFIKISNQDRQVILEYISWFMDTLFESYYDNMELVDDEKKAPDFLKNMPPFESSHSIEPLPFEKKLRKEESIDGLCCYAGEVLFFLYAWRLLMYYAQQDGLEAIFDINLSLDTEKNDFAKDPFTWDKQKWEKIETPEKKWLYKLRENKKWWDDRYEHDKSIPSYYDLEKTWKSIRSFTNPMNKPNNDFISVEWDFLGLDNKYASSNFANKALRAYALHVLRQIKSPSYIVAAPMNFLSTLNNVGEINKAIDYIISLHDEGLREKYLSMLFFKNHSDEHWHYIYKKTIYCCLSYDSEIPMDSLTISQSFQILHNKTRFPIIPLFFQIALSEDRLPREFLVCPIAKSFSNAFEVPFHTKKRTEEIDTISKQYNKVAFTMLSIKPIQTLDETYKITNNYDHFTGQEGEDMSIIGRLRLRCIQDFMSVISEPMVDKAFYDKIIKKETEKSTIKSQYFAFAHESYKIIRHIDPDTPSYALNEIRQFLIITFGTIDQINQEKQISTFFGNSISKLVENTFNYAVRIEVLSELLIKGNSLKEDSKEDFDIFYEKLLGKVKIINNINKSFTFLYNNNNIALSKQILYLFLALLAALRNIYTHHKIGSNITFELKESNQEYYIRIVNFYEEKDDFHVYKKVEHLGKTIDSLYYFVEQYSKMKPESREVPTEKNKWETIIPLPFSLTKKG